MSLVMENWRTSYRPSWLCLKDLGHGKAQVVRVSPTAALGASKVRIYEAWLNGQRIYDPEQEFRPGQVVDVPASPA